jgi:hypothetical protein
MPSSPKLYLVQYKWEVAVREKGWCKSSTTPEEVNAKAEGRLVNQGVKYGHLNTTDSPFQLTFT